MKHFFTALLLAFTFAASAQSTAKLDEEYGLMGVKLESSISSIKDISLSTDDGDEKSYFADSTGFFGSGIPVDDILYTFYKDKLYSMTIMIEGRENGLMTFATLADQYGDPVFYKDAFHWVGNRTVLSYWESKDKKDSYAMLKSRYVDSIRKADKEKIEASGPSTKKLNAQYGFNGWKLESPPSSIQDITPGITLGDVKTYSASSGSIGNEIPVKDITYSFHKDRLYIIAIEIEPQNSEKMFQWLTTQYGEGSRSDDNPKEYSWTSKKVYLTYREGPSNTHVVVTSVPILDERAAARRNK